MRQEIKSTVKEAIVEWGNLAMQDDLPIKIVDLDEYITAKVMLLWERIQDRR